MMMKCDGGNGENHVEYYKSPPWDEPFLPGAGVLNFEKKFVVFLVGDDVLM